MNDVVVLGAGAWGTAIACHLAARAAADPRVTLWARDGAQAQAMANHRENARYLPGIPLPAALRITSDPSLALRADILFAAVPVAELPRLAEQLIARGARAPLVWLCKGFVAAPALPGGAGLAHQVMAARWPSPVAVASGPSFAEEVARGLPT
ncbi:MAG: 2-dehydropantoate 2-reductase N-terminal domain-containing protein, partial [Betaproteobacteria bacterium]